MLSKADQSEQVCFNVFVVFGVQLVLAGSEGGLINLWDLRGGKNSAAFVTAGEVSDALSPHLQTSAVLIVEEISTYESMNQDMKATYESRYRLTYLRTLGFDS